MAYNFINLSIETVLNTLRTFNYTSVDGDKLEGEDGVEVSYQVKLANSLMDMDTLPLQVVIYVRINGQHAYTWGCESNEDNGKFVKWFVHTKMIVDEDRFEKEDKLSEEARTSWSRRLEEQYELEKS